MRTVIEPTHIITLYISGPRNIAEQVCREYCYGKKLCVTIEDTAFIYMGGQEAGIRIGLLNYPRFPSTPEWLLEAATELAKLLIERLYRDSALIVNSNPATTTWITRREHSGHA